MSKTIALALFASACLCAAPAPAGAQNPDDVHWSRQFPNPANSTQMGPGTGMSQGHTKPSFKQVKWHDGKLYMSGAWEAGVEPFDLTKKKPNIYWHMWSWSPTAGYEPVVWFGGQGGSGPDGKIFDFLWLPDGRLVVGGSFTRLDNPGGTRFRNVNALAVYDPKEPTANKWTPLGSCQYNGTVSAGGTIYSLAYDPQGNDLYMGGSFGGIPFKGPTLSHRFHKYDFDTQSYEPVFPGVGGAKPTIHQIQVDTSTQPSTIYVAGKFHYTAGNGQTPAVSDSTSRYSTGFAKYQEGKGWTTYPPQADARVEADKDEAVLQRAADFMHFDSVQVFDFLVDGEDIWVVGAFSEGKGSGETLRGIAKWDAAKGMWIDPTGKGGVGREVWDVAKADDGRIYFAGAFGGRNAEDVFFDGFKDGTEAHCAMSYDPATGAWEQLGSGLSSLVFPEVRMCVDGNDVYYVGDFQYIGVENFGAKGAKDMQSQLIARWNSTVDFVANPPEVSDTQGVTSHWTPPTQPLMPAGNEHWSRGFPKPPRAKGRQHQMSGATGMDPGMGAPEISAIAQHDGTLYFGGSWQAVMNQRWWVWSYHAERGYEPIAWEDKGQNTGIPSPALGLTVHEGKLYAYGAIREPWMGIGIYDPATKEWSKLEGTFNGESVVGNAGNLRGIAGLVNDIAWDSKTGDMYLAGQSGLENPDYEHPRDVGQVIRIDKDGQYHPMGHSLKPEDPNKPILRIQCIALDETQDPTAIYVGGTFNYYGPVPTTHARMAFNVVQWDHAAQDWAPVGKGDRYSLREIDAKYYPEGHPGLPCRTEQFQGFLGAIFPHVKDLAVDKDGNLWAGGSLGIRQHGVPVKDRTETFGIARWNKATGLWECPTTVGGVARDVYQMTFLDDTHLLLSGGFLTDERWRPLNNVAILDTATGELNPMGGGLLRSSNEGVIAVGAVHTVVGDDIYFAGLFDHAGVNANAMLQGPIESYYVARWNGTQNLDPNRGLSVAEVEPVSVKAGRSASAKVKLQASLSEGGGAITWYERRANGDYAKKGSGEAYTANVRAKAGEDLFYYVTVTREGEPEGAKQPVRIPVVVE